MVPQPSVPSYTPPPSYAPTPSYGTPTRANLAPAKLIITGSGAILALPNASQAVIGRADPVSKFFPEIDLGPYGALDHGVGRRHARLFLLNNQIMIEDLDSTNGTSLNGARLGPRQPRALKHGDTISIGRLALHLQE
jgi:pSer/pThr/pTyr-binding forkhead associated (FHA) protein